MKENFWPNERLYFDETAKNPTVLQETYPATN